jgi:hypothetical protein
LGRHPQSDAFPHRGIDLATGRPLLTGIYKDFLAGSEVEIFPSRGSNAVPKRRCSPAKSPSLARPAPE